MNPPKNLEVDHINNDKLDNRVSNLRVITHRQNLLNRLHLFRNNKSGYRGVSWSKGMKKWVAQITRNNKTISLGFFNDPRKAAKKYNEYAIN